MRTLLLLLCLTPCTQARAQTQATSPTSPWDGTYKLDYNRSHLLDDPFTYSKAPNGSWQFITANQTFSFAPDGKPHPLRDADHTQTVTMPDPHTLLIVMQTRGRTTRTIHETLSTDANTLTDITVGKNRDASTYTNTQTSQRTAPGEDFFGQWTPIRITGDSPANATLTITTAPDGTITWNYFGTDTITGQPDGTPQPVTGAHVPPGDAISFRKISSRRIDFITSHNTQIRTIGYMQLSADSKSIDDVNWLPTSPTAKEIKVYVRQ